MQENTHALIKEMKEYATSKNIPIMMDGGIDFLTTFIIKNQIKNILEIGTAIGFSSIMMALANPTLKIVSIEKDNERYLEAVKNIKKFNLEDRITLIYKDALEFKTDDKFDLIFIDAAKGKNMVFFDKFEKNLDQDGFIVTDNIKFHGYVEKEESEIKSRNLRGLVRKIKEYINFLKNNTKYTTEFYSVGDGIAVSKRK